MELHETSVAMPLIGTGDQGNDPYVMLQTILDAAQGWINRGLPLLTLKIVLRNETIARRGLEIFQAKKMAKPSPPPAGPSTDNGAYDAFVSYSHKESVIAQTVAKTLSDGSLKIFLDRKDLREGSSWALDLASALDRSSSVVALYSSSYWNSKNCQMEFLAALARQNDTGKNILFPLYLSDANIPYMFRTVQYADCRLEDSAKISKACARLLANFRQRL